MARAAQRLRRQQRAAAAAAVDEQIAALRERVHRAPLRTCACCGVVAEVPADSPTFERTGLDGVAISFGICRTCAALDTDLDRAVAAQVLGLPFDAPILDGVTVERYADVPGARPTLPNSRPWQHITRRELAAAVLEHQRHQAELVNAVACVVCGTNQRFEDYGYTSTSPDFARCPSCQDRLANRLQHLTGGDWQRDIVAGVLTGTAPVDGRGRQLSVRFASELSSEERDALPALRASFMWHHRDIARWCTQLGVEVPTRIEW